MHVAAVKAVQKRNSQDFGREKYPKPMHLPCLFDNADAIQIADFSLEGRKCLVHDLINWDLIVRI